MRGTAARKPAPRAYRNNRPENTRKGIDAHVALAQGRGARPSAVAEMQARISPELWHQVLRAHPFLAALDDQEGAQLLARSAWLLASKSINGAQGLDVTDAMRLSIAAQASLPILNLTPSLYEGWNEIIVYPAGFRIPARARTPTAWCTSTSRTRPARPGMAAR